MTAARRLGTAAVGGGLYVLAMMLGPAPVAAAAEAIPVQTAPPVSGATISVGGLEFVTDSLGRATISVPTQPAGASARRITSGVKVTPPTDGDRRRVRFARWSGGRLGLTASFQTYARVQPRFIGQEGERIDPARIDSMTLVSSTERRRTVSGHRPFWLQSGQVALHPGGANQRVAWSIESVIVDGSNVVNRAQQRFLPAKRAELTVPLLFYSATISAEDALFGFPIGSAVEVRAPDGSVSRVALGPDATATLPELPRGEYELKVDAFGVSFTQPVTVSRDQTLVLSVISVLDILVGLIVLVAIALALLLARRPTLRARLRRTPRELAAHLEPSARDPGKGGA